MWSPCKPVSPTPLVHPNGPNPHNSGTLQHCRLGVSPGTSPILKVKKKDRRKIDDKKESKRIKIELPCSGWLLFRLNTDRKISVMKVPIAMILSDMAPCQHNTSQPKIAECLPESQCGNWKFASEIGNLKLKSQIPMYSWTQKQVLCAALWALI